MPKKTLLVGAVSLLGMVSASGTALAGHCSQGQNCDMGVTVHNDYAPKFDNMTVRNTPPFGHFSSVNFQRAPNVSITRVHGMMPSAGLSDAPSAFTGGCHPESTQYCRTDVGTPVSVELSAPATPVYNVPMPSAPVVTAPRPLRVWVGKGYDPSKFTPRVYGDPSLVPGIAYLPTSRVVRDPAAADAMLNSGRTQPQPIANGGVAPRPSMVRPSMMPSVSYTQPSFAQPAMGSLSFSGPANGSYGAMPPPVLTGTGVAYDGNGPKTILRETPFPTMAGAPVNAGNNTYVSNIGADGTYWEKTSGLTTFGSTVATQVICKRKIDQKVVNPVVGVPVAVPTPAPVPYCGTPNHSPAPHAHPQMQGQYGPMAGRWTY